MKQSKCCDFCIYYDWYYEWCNKWNCGKDYRSVCDDWKGVNDE